MLRHRSGVDGTGMQVAYLKSGKRLEVVKALDLGRGYSLLLIKDEQGIASQVFAPDEIDRFAQESDNEGQSSRL